MGTRTSRSRLAGSLDVVQELHSRMMFVIIHCQLSPIDARSIIPLLDQHTPSLNQLAQIVLPQSLEQAVNYALRRYYVGWDRQLEDGDQLKLTSSTDIGYLSLEQSISNTWVVMATPKKALDKTKIGHGMLSCYFDQHRQQEMSPVVILPQLQVRRSHAPQELLASRLWTPMSHFKSDGRLDLTEWKHYLSVRIKTAQQFQNIEDNGWDVIVEPVEVEVGVAVAVALPSPMPMTTIPTNARQLPSGITLLYLRVSSGDKHIYGNGLAKQLCYILPRIQDLIRETTKLYVIAECNSSSMYRWQNRNMWIQFYNSLYNSLEQDHGPIGIVTATPDRLTRRPEVIPLIHAQFERQRFDEDQHQDLAAKLTLSMNISLQFVYYNRGCEQMAKTVNQIRYIQELQAHGNATGVWKIAFIRAQRQLVTRFCLERHITLIVIVSRTSPEWSKRQNDKNCEPSLNLQEYFCHQFVDPLNLNVQSSDTTYGRARNILILASSFERLTRRQEQLLEMLAWQERNIWVMSFLWPLRRELPYPTDTASVARFIDIVPQNLEDPQLIQDIVNGFARTIALRSTIYGHPVVMPMVLSDHNLSLIGAAVSDAENFVTRNIDVVYWSTTLPQNAPRHQRTQRGVLRRWEDFWKGHISQTTGKLQSIFT
ncbi:hypothetical protein INT43_007495 [Umbelopsis isabellina]|uniref:Uncharacterized protein n=1 Tax=Mortierella isabellina TaxID=91625 RepID=A0A8H7PXQ0_MORIS|nr:hypothetical protein INT43_007495 [Umbelopsis isabellina]